MEKSGILEFEREGELGILTISNPPKNRLPDPVIADADDLVRWLHGEGLKGAVLTGSGNNFSEGADIFALESMKHDLPEMRRRLDKGKEVLCALRDSPVPIVAAINGACFGGGLEIALACHIRVAGSSALFGFPEAELGLLPGLGGTVSSVEELSLQRALPFLLSSETLSSERARELGIVHYVTPRKEVLQKAKDLVHYLTRDKNTAVINNIMRAVMNGRKLDRRVALQEESRYFCELVMMRERGEGTLSTR